MSAEYAGLPNKQWGVTWFCEQSSEYLGEEQEKTRYEKQSELNTATKQNTKTNTMRS